MNAHTRQVKRYRQPVMVYRLGVVSVELADVPDCLDAAAIPITAGIRHGWDLTGEQWQALPLLFIRTDRIVGRHTDRTRLDRWRALEAVDWPPLYLEARQFPMVGFVFYPHDGQHRTQVARERGLGALPAYVYRRR